jgi:alkanesulfonate monooxygenase SsuD/methylene tetrahydromethanopterin reductase-like flavin-dependent oxidoreductase (luciferase family)
MVGVNVFAADTDEEARFLATSVEQAIVNLRTGRPGRLPPPSHTLRWSSQERAILDRALSCSAIGSPATVARWLEGFAKRTGADEFIIAAQMFDHQARLRSYELTANSREVERERLAAGAP